MWWWWESCFQLPGRAGKWTQYTLHSAPTTPRAGLSRETRWPRAPLNPSYQQSLEEEPALFPSVRDVTSHTEGTVPEWTLFH